MKHLQARFVFCRDRSLQRQAIQSGKVTSKDSEAHGRWRREQRGHDTCSRLGSYESAFAAMVATRCRILFLPLILTPLYNTRYSRERAKRGCAAQLYRVTKVAKGPVVRGNTASGGKERARHRSPPHLVQETHTSHHCDWYAMQS